MLYNIFKVMRNAIETKQFKKADYFTIWFNILSNL